MYVSSAWCVKALVLLQMLCMIARVCVSLLLCVCRKSGCFIERMFVALQGGVETVLILVGVFGMLCDIFPSVAHTVETAINVRFCVHFELSEDNHAWLCDSYSQRRAFEDALPRDVSCVECRKVFLVTSMHHVVEHASCGGTLASVY